MHVTVVEYKIITKSVVDIKKYCFLKLTFGLKLNLI